MASTSENAATAPLEDALAKNVEATEEVKQVADNLAVVHAVLEKAPEGAPVEDIERAVEQAEVLKEQLSTAAEKLDDVNDTLAEELKARGMGGIIEP
ncbi:hypothetical protein J7E62_29090 [Variovorax paradoxus]|nr:hypothetical protein [Variovorax paradoxus]